MTILRVSILSIALSGLGGCKQQNAADPPSVRIGDSVCEQCNMIISDVRWATATIVDGPRGPEARLFDDFNCQVNYEVEHADLNILTRWSHNRNTSRWIETEQAVFLMSPGLRTPMGSNLAAFASKSEAEAARAELTGDVMDFKTAWTRLGFVGACCPGDAHEISTGTGISSHVQSKN